MNFKRERERLTVLSQDHMLIPILLSYLSPDNKSASYHRDMMEEYQLTFTVSGVKT